MLIRNIRLFSACIVAVLGLLLTSPDASAANIIIGEAKVLSTSDGGNANLLCSQNAVLSRPAAIISLSFYGSLLFRDGVKSASVADHQRRQHQGRIRKQLPVICVSTNMYADLRVNPRDRKHRSSSRSRHLSPSPFAQARTVIRPAPCDPVPIDLGHRKTSCDRRGGHKRDGANSPGSWRIAFGARPGA
jgi:hypothetical protein